VQATDFWAFFQKPPRGFEASRDLVQNCGASSEDA
jgi:hypothetical protein